MKFSINSNGQPRGPHRGRRTAPAVLLSLAAIGLGTLIAGCTVKDPAIADPSIEAEAQVNQALDQIDDPQDVAIESSLEASPAN